MIMYMICQPTTKFQPMWLHTLADSPTVALNKFFNNFSAHGKQWEDYQTLGFELHKIEIVDKGPYENTAA